MAIAISAAATTKIRNTSTAPAVESICCAKVTRLRLTPFSMSSMHISITSTLRRTMTPRSPSANSARLTETSSCTLSTFPPVHLAHGDGRHHGSHQQHGDELELQPVFVQEGGGELAQAEGRGAGGLGKRRRVLPRRVHEHAEEQERARDAGHEQAREAAGE